MAGTESAPYGDVPYADDGLQDDHVKRYPVDTGAHAKAAWSFINMAANAAKYSAADLATVKGKILTALHHFDVEVTGEHALPRDGLVRAISGCEVRDAPAGEAGPGTMHGHLAVFNQWSEINSIHEGHFMERIAPDAFDRTLAARGHKVKVTFNHGKDPQLGDKVLGIPTVLQPDAHGVRYEVPLFDTSYNRDLAPGLKAGAYGSSFRFNVLAEDFNKRAKRSEYNPHGIPERTVRELHMPEFGPVTFPAYEGASAGMRSLTDRFYSFLPGVQAVRTAPADEFLALIGR
jgi:hypothetical protein